MLVIALARRDERQGRYIAARQIRIQAPRAVEADDVFRTIVPLQFLLRVLEVYERIMLRGISLYDARRGQGREFREVGQVARCAVAVVNTVGPAERKILLVTLPSQAATRELVSDRFAFCLRSRHRLQSVDV